MRKLDGLDHGQETGIYNLATVRKCILSGLLVKCLILSKPYHYIRFWCILMRKLDGLDHGQETGIYNLGNDLGKWHWIFDEYQ